MSGELESERGKGSGGVCVSLFFLPLSLIETDTRAQE